MKNSFVLITGASSGIGWSTACILAKNNFNVIVCGRRTNKLIELKNHIRSFSQVRVHTLSFDLTDNNQVEEAINSLDFDKIRIDILINNAGLAVGKKSIEEGLISDWETMIDTNFKGLLYMSRLVIPPMVERQSGMVINVGSTSGHQAYANGNVYCATKAALNMLTRTMRLDLFKKGIKVCEVNPAHVETEFSLVRFKGDKQKAAIYEDFTPLYPEDVARAILYLIDQPPHITIQRIDLAGTQQATANFIDRSGKKYI